MRVWDVDPDLLCKSHMGGEHREIHAIWNIIYYNKKGYSFHPETKRWIGKLDALKKRHDSIIHRFKNHNSPLISVGDCDIQKEFVNTIEEQIVILRGKHCGCKI